MQNIDVVQLHALVKNSAKPYVLVNFYTTQSKACVKELPGLIQLHKNPGELVEVLFVSVENSTNLPQNLKNFWGKYESVSSSFHLDSAVAETFVGNLDSTWNYRIPVNLLFTNQGRLVDVIRMTDPMEVRMIISKDQSFHF
ncbi:MAG: hypothetical protein SF052_25615 [Bacteroidia bacterium]|nr:hypothetical protein [Bacteroidia bacterium]